MTQDTAAVTYHGTWHVQGSVKRPVVLNTSAINCLKWQIVQHTVAAQMGGSSGKLHSNRALLSGIEQF